MGPRPTGRGPAVQDFASYSWESRAGNLYIDRKRTGPMVGAHPFGGFGMSGTNSKAGGRDDLRLVLEVKLGSEKM